MSEGVDDQGGQTNPQDHLHWHKWQRSSTSANKDKTDKQHATLPKCPCQWPDGGLYRCRSDLNQREDIADLDGGEAEAICNLS